MNQKEAQVFIKTNTSYTIDFSSILEETLNKYQNGIKRVNELRLNAWFMQGLTQHAERKVENQSSLDQIKNDERTVTIISEAISTVIIDAYEKEKLKKKRNDFDSTHNMVEVCIEVHIGHNEHYNHRANKL